MCRGALARVVLLKRVGRALKQYLVVPTSLGLRGMLTVAANRLASLNHYYVLHMNLSTLGPAKRLRLLYGIRRISPDDLRILTHGLKALDLESRKEVGSRLLFYRAGFTNCYVARGWNDEIAYIQWIVYPSENTVIRKRFRKIFSPLRNDQVMVENAFTFPRFRGLGLMPAVTHELLNMARQEGYTRAICYIRKDRIAALNDFIKLGFKITRLIAEYRFVGFTVRGL